VDLTEEVKELLIKTAKELQGCARRLFLARTVRALGEGGQRQAEEELGWNRGLMRKGEHELKSGVVCVDAFNQRGRKRCEEHLPNLLKDITAIVDGQSQADPQFRSARLYTRLTAAEVRRQLVTTYHYMDAQLPTTATITRHSQRTGLHAQKGGEDAPPKKLPETDAIFDHLKEVNAEADAEGSTLRLSMDAKRGSQNRSLRTRRKKPGTDQSG